MKSPTRLSAAGLALSFAFAAAASDWPQWHGPRRDGHAGGARPLTALPKDLKPIWKISVGGGHSSPVVAGGKVVFVDENGTREVAHALDAATGQELWHVDYANVFRDEWGAGPRATPMVDGEHVYVQSCDGEFRCLRLKDGSTVWSVNFEKDFAVKFLGSKANEGTATRRGNNGTGVIDGSRLILPVGGRGVSLVCFDKLTGKVLWKSGDDEAAYASLMVGTLAGVKQVVAFTADALLGANLEDGRVLWRVPLKTNAKRHAATPVLLANDRVVVNSHSFGLRCFAIAQDTGGLKATEAWSNPDLAINLATLLANGTALYGQGAKSDLICVDAATGKLQWSQTGFGAGKKDYASTIGVGDKLLCLTEGGQLLLLAANPEKYTELGRLQVCGSTWSFPACANGKLFVRDARQLLCLDLEAR